AVAGFERQLGRPDRPLQHRRVHHVREQAPVPEQTAGIDGLGLSLRAQTHVDPAGEEAERVPLALPVAQQEEPRRGHDPASATAAIIPENSSAFRLAPPTRHPSQAASSTYEVTLSALTLPP